MANPAEILSDPDFVNANAATKQAIFARHVANDPDFKSANVDTQQAIKMRFGFAAPAQPTEGMPGPRGGDEFSDMTGAKSRLAAQAAQAENRSKRGILEKYVAPVLEVPLAIATGIPGVISEQLTGTNIGYKPVSGTSQDILSDVQKAFEASKLEGLMGLPARAPVRTVAPAVNRAAPVVRTAAGEIAESKPVQAIVKPLQERKARIQEENVARSYENADQIDAAKLAVKHKIVIDPAISNPTTANRLKSGAVKATNFAENAAKINDKRFTQLAKEDMGLPPNTVLDAKAFETALSKHSAPYEKIGQIPQLVPDQGVLSEIESLRINRPAIGGEASAAAVNSLIDEALAKVAEGRSGAEIITDIRKLRKDANNVYTAQQKSGVPDPTLIAKADANIGVANALENLIEANVADPKLLGDLRKARADMAKIYDYERATNFATNRIDPQVLAKMVKDDKPLSGIAADIGKIAAVFPDIAQTGQTGVPGWAKSFSRSGAAGTTGLATAALFGAPLIPGAVIGAGVGYVGGGMAARRMASPAYQAANAVPRDFRAPVNNLRPVAPSTTANLPVPYDFRNALLTQDQIPNWVYGRAESDPNLRVGVPNAPALEAPSPQSTMNFVNQQRAYEYQKQRAAAEAADAAQAQREAAARVPTSNETLFELDPITGKLRNVSQGMKGATPDVLQSTGRSLEAAAEKVASGQKFAMSAEEKIAWDKTKVDLKVLDSSLAKLSDKAIAEKAMDRAWVEEAIVKARQQAAAFDEIAKRAKDAQQVQRAIAEREKLMDALEALEPSLGKPRATSSGEQGPKTRAAIRNRLAPEPKNNLRND